MQRLHKLSLGFALIATLSLTVAFPTVAQTINAPYASDYSFSDLGSISGLPTSYGGLTLLAGDTNTLLVGGSANSASGGIYSIGVTRDGSNHITGFSGSPTLYSTAPYIDGGLAYGPDGVLFYTAYPTNQIGEIKPGSTSPDKVVTATGVTSSVGSLTFVPAGFAGAGQLKVVSYSGGTVSTVPYTSDGAGTFTLGTPTSTVTIGGAPEGIAYVSGTNADFGSDSVLVSEYGTGSIASYQIDANGDPIVGTRQTFLSGLSGAEGAFIDPVTGDFLFTTYGGGNHLVEVRGFTAPPVSTPEPSSVATLGFGLLGLAGLGFMSRKRKAQSIAP